MQGDIWVLIPLLILVSGAVAVYLVARLITSRNTWLAAITSFIFAGTLGSWIHLSQRLRAARSAALPFPAWGDFEPGGAALRAEPGALFIGGIALGLGLCVAIYSGHYLLLDHRYRTYYPLLLLLVAGLLGMMMATDLFGLYIFCELMSVTAYVLVAFRRRTATAVEAGFKYLIMGSVGTLTLLMGVALIYRETGSLTLPQTIVTPGIWARAGLACLLVGLGIKSAIVPAHTWLPDAHGRAPSSISAMLSGVIIQGAFYAQLRVALGLGFGARDLGAGLMVLAVLNMTVGNALALVQKYTKRMLAYSTIAQMGYVMFSIGVGLRYALPTAVQAGFFLLLAHAAMKGLAFLCKGVCHFYEETTLIEELRGTYRRLPLVAVTFTIALVSLVGIPPLAGFVGKWFVLAEVLRAGDWLVVAGVVILLANTLLSLGYYLPLIAVLYTPPLPGEDTARVAVSRWMSIPLILLSVVVLVLGLVPGWGLSWATDVLTFGGR